MLQTFELIKNLFGGGAISLKNSDKLKARWTVEERGGPVEERAGPVEERYGPVEEGTRPVEERSGTVEKRDGPMEERTLELKVRKQLMTPTSHNYLNSCLSSPHWFYDNEEPKMVLVKIWKQRWFPSKITRKTTSKEKCIIRYVQAVSVFKTFGSKNFRMISCLLGLNLMQK
ncbi:predicted protein [Arabidopsis lyrata subsp. lyrata]|uniref:Predicted protein n=1 Tax=Arabidopsis lyrata subsp. lyrata TaxID=81972 RepID=D7LNV0_ARALL|nr:predicted protein [Arabidopsis lyrata subsp. lyrata]